MNIHKASKYRYGAYKIHASFKANGITIQYKKNSKIDEKNRSKICNCKEIQATSSKHKIVEQENVLKRDFQTKNINEKWVTDITYIHTIKDGWCYLASIMALYSKKIIGYAISKFIDTTLAL